MFEPRANRRGIWSPSRQREETICGEDRTPTGDQAGWLSESELEARYAEIARRMAAIEARKAQKEG